MKRRFRIIGMVVLVILMLTACANSKKTNNLENNITNNLNAIDLSTGFEAGTSKEFKLITENNNLSLSANLFNGEIMVKDKQSGKEWYSNPIDKESDAIANGYNKVALLSQVLLTYSTSEGVPMNVGSFMGSVSKKGLTYRIDSDSIIFRYEFVKEELIVPVRYSITDTDFVAELLTAGVEEKSTNRISTIDFLPFFGAGSMEDNGYILVPDGSGALINFNNGKTSAEEFSMNLFGYDNGINDRLINSTTALTKSFTVSENAYLPVFGEKCNEDGFLAIMTSGAARASIHARAAGKYTSYNNVWSAYNYRTVGTVRLMQKEMNEKTISIPEKNPETSVNYEVRYRFLKNGHAEYSDMAKVYRDHLIETEGLIARTKEGDIPFYLDVYGYIRKTKSFLGIPKDTLIVTTSVTDSSQIVKELQDNGIGNIALKYNYWMKDGYYKTIQTGAKIESKIGNLKDMKSLEEQLKSKGGSLYLATELLNVYKTGKGVSKYNNILNSVSNTPQMQYEFSLDSASKDPRYKPWYLVKPNDMSKYFNKFLHNFEKTGFTNVAFESIGTMAYSDLSSKGTSRTRIPELENTILVNALNQVDNIMLSGANSYAAVTATHILNSPVKSSNYDIEDASVPFFQMVFHGYLYYSLGATNLSSNPTEVALKCLEYGASPIYSWVARNSEELIGSRTDELFSPVYSKWLNFAAEEYKEINSVLKDTATVQITSHRILQEGVTETVYGDSMRVIVNYNSADVTIDGNPIAGKDYLVIRE
jgi:hypothetical protein